MSHVDEGQLAAYVDDDWAGVGGRMGQENIERHLADCAACRKRLADIQRVREQAIAILRSGDPVASVPPGFTDIAARARIQHRASADRRQIRALRSLSWAAVLAIAVAVGWYGRLWVVNRPDSIADTRTMERSSREQAPVATAPPIEAGQPDGEPVTPGQAPAATATPPVAAPPAVPPAEDSRAQQQLRDPVTPDPEPARRELAIESAPAQAAPAPAADAVDTAAAQAKVAEADSQPLGRQDAPAAANLAVRIDPEWVPADLVQATAALGRQPMLVPGLEIVGYAVARDEPGTVRLTHRLGDETLELIQVASGITSGGDLASRAQAGAASRAASPPTAQAEFRRAVPRTDARFAGVTIERPGMSVTARASISNDSLRVLLGRLR